MNIRPPGRALILIGFMGAGKSSVGRALAEALGWDFEDLDQRVEQREGRSVAAIFRDDGEAVFRRAEYTALVELLGELRTASSRIIALGGGAFAQETVRALIDSAKLPTIFLDASAEELWYRCQRQSEESGAERPLLGTKEGFQLLYAQRRLHYLRAVLRQETGGKSVESIVVELLEALQLKAAGTTLREKE